MIGALRRFFGPDPISLTGPYYAELRHLTHAKLRRAWIAEGERRGYVLVDA